MSTASTSEKALTITHRMTVTEDQIDHLGHMNVRFYGVAAHSASRALAARIGVGETTEVEIFDTYTRHHHEQLLGNDLEVASGVLGADAEHLRIYHELRNPAADQIAATFVHRVHAEAPLGDAVIDQAEALHSEVPPHGQTRSIDLAADPQASAPTLEALQERDLAMRHPRAVSAEECDAHGEYLPAMAPMLTWGGEPLRGSMQPMLHDGPNGEKMGWASMETRMVIGRLPRLGDQIQAFGANLEIADKISHRIQWAYGLDDGALLCSFEVISLAFDTVARRSMKIPDDIRAQHQREHHPDLAPKP